ncbi:MAG: outer membrane protein assembly factor BamA [Candidatus Aureabacteria bacterium]|nr:outer membrane protein assembly factor BamA [Candidatus Auribacterota bacterium]
MRNSRPKALKRAFPFFLGALVFFLGLPPLLPAARENTVAEVLIEGNVRLNASAIMSRIKTRTGQPYAQETLNADLKRLYDWGPLASVSVDVQETPAGGFRVTFRVEEKPTISRIIFEGNREFSGGKLLGEISSVAGEPLSEPKLREDAAKIFELYEKEGYLQARIDYQIKAKPESGEATVIFVVAEGREARIKTIAIVGAKAIDPDDLLGLMETHSRSLFGILHTGIFRKDEFEADLEKITQYCHNQGYLDMKALKTENVFSPDKGSIFITIAIEEGKRYSAGTIGLSGNEVFSESELRSLLALKPGAVFSYQAVRLDVRALQDFYSSKGYIDAVVRPSTVYDPAKDRMDVAYALRENQLSYINRIDISGNTVTKDIVIRRELAVRPGEVCDGIKIRRSEERISNLGFFQKVTIDPVASEAPGSKDLAIRVEEKKTGEFLFGVGYSSIDDLIGFAEIGLGNFDLFHWPNFLGAGQKIRLRGEFGSTRDNYELSFTEPWIFGVPLSFGVDLYRRDWVWEDYKERRKGGDIRLRRRLTGFAEANLTYDLEQVEIYSVASDAYWSIQSEAGKNWVSSLTPGLSYDSRDSYLIPTRGVNATINCEVAGGILGGDKDFVKTIFSGSLYYSIFEGHILGFRVMAGSAQPYSDTEIVPVYERFFLGGANSIRGFRYREVGPYDTLTDDPIGGDSMVLGSVEYTFPIWENTIRGALFFDIGNVWVDDTWSVVQPGDPPMDVFSNPWLKSLNSAAGIGLRLYLPIGPIKLDYGWPLRSGPDGWNDAGGRFNFNIGYAF